MLRKHLLTELCLLSLPEEANRSFGLVRGPVGRTLGRVKFRHRGNVRLPAGSCRIGRLLRPLKKELLDVEVAAPVDVVPALPAS